jgi:hypothetical protein
MSKKSLAWMVSLSAVVLFAAAFPLACSSSATETGDAGGGGGEADSGGPVEDAGGGADAGAVGDAGAGEDAGTVEDAGEADAGEADAGAPFDGGGQTVGMFLNIGLIQMMGQNIGLATAGFYPETAYGPWQPLDWYKGLAPGTCRNPTNVAPLCTADADCKYAGQTCVLDTDNSGNPVPNTGHCVNPKGAPIDIGPVTLKGLAGGPNELKYNSGQKGAYTVDGAGDGSIDPASITTDATYSFNGSGDPAQGLGAFSGTLYVPPALKITEPVATPGQFGDEIPIDTTKDVVLKWEGSSNGYVHVTLQGDNSGVECLTKDDGEFTIPASMLTTLKPGAFAIMNIVNIERRAYGTTKGQGLANAEVESIVSTMVFWKVP